MTFDQNPKSKIENRKSKIDNYPSLAKSYKKAFPFKIGTTSYIFPDHIIPNVSAVGPYMDEIELILFESKAESLPTGREIKMLETLSKDLDITFNVHLPLDVFLGSQDDIRRKESIKTVNAIINLSAPLNPTTHTLHIEYGGPQDDEEYRKTWKSRLFESFEELTKRGMNGKSISVETLSYPLEWIDDIIEAFGLDVCLDVGHLLFADIPLLETYNRYCDRISVYHLHGIKAGRDHQSLDHLSEATWNVLRGMLNRFRGVVSIEVFSFENLKQSLWAFDKKLSHIDQMGF